MQSIEKITGDVAILFQANIDTDVIIPQTELLTTQKTGLGKGLFARWRYDENRNLKPDFVLNQAAARNVKILIADENFGCGSSREHAVWALKEFGILCVIAPSFGEIFYQNCFRNGLIAAVVDRDILLTLIKKITGLVNVTATIDVKYKTIQYHSIMSMPFTLSARHCDSLLSGTDEIESVLSYRNCVDKYFLTDMKKRPWVYAGKK